jgi:hypothetical protein
LLLKDLKFLYLGGNELGLFFFYQFSSGAGEDIFADDIIHGFCNFRGRYIAPGICYPDDVFFVEFSGESHFQYSSGFHLFSSLVPGLVPEPPLYSL